MRILLTLLAVLITSINIFRYNLPTYLHNISIFDLLTLGVLAISLLGWIFDTKKNTLTKGLIVFNFLGCLDSIADELWFDPTLWTDGDWKITIGTAIFCIGYMAYQVKIKGNPLL